MDDRSVNFGIEGLAHVSGAVGIISNGLTDRVFTNIGPFQAAHRIGVLIAGIGCRAVNQRDRSSHRHETGIYSCVTSQRVSGCAAHLLSVAVLYFEVQTVREEIFVNIYKAGIIVLLDDHPHFIRPGVCQVMLVYRADVVVLLCIAFGILFRDEVGLIGVQGCPVLCFTFFQGPDPVIPSLIVFLINGCPADFLLCRDGVFPFAFFYFFLYDDRQRIRTVFLLITDPVFGAADSFFIIEVYICPGIDDICGPLPVLVQQRNLAGFAWNGNVLIPGEIKGERDRTVKPGHKLDNIRDNGTGQLH